MRTCKTCGQEIAEEKFVVHRVKAHGDVDAVKYLPQEEREGTLKKVMARNLYLSGIPIDIIALQLDLDVPTLTKIIDEILKWAV